MGNHGSKYQVVTEDESKGALLSETPPVETLKDVLSVVDDQERKYILTEYYNLFGALKGFDQFVMLEIMKEIRHLSLRELIGFLCRKIRHSAGIVGGSAKWIEAYKSLILEIKMILKARGEW